MDAISIRCKSCKHAMKFSVEKAGKKAKCPKCGTLSVIPQVKEKPPEEVDEAADMLLSMEDDPAPMIKAVEEEAAPMVMATAEESDVIQMVEEAPPVVQAPPPPPPEAPPKPKDEFEDDGPTHYGVYVDPELVERQRILKEEEAAKAKKKKEKKKLPKVTRKIKAIEDADAWEKVKLGLLFLMIGACIWFVIHLLQGIYVLTGSVELPEYASLIASSLELRLDPDVPGIGQFWDVDEFDVYMGMIAGRDFSGFAKSCLTIACFLYLLQGGVWALGYVFCFPVPRRVGMFGQVLTMMGLLVFNGVAALCFKLLPVVGAYNYIMIPFVAPEISMTDYNMERMVPINILWSGAPFWENFLNVVFKITFYLEPTIACVFLWSIGVAIKKPEIAQSGKALAQMCLGTLFVLLAFHLLSLCGASPVLVIVLRVFYVVWYFFCVIFVLQFIMLLLKVRSVLEEKIHPKNEAEE